ncbi:helix-turn-helix domain-containing protein [Cohnella herbarum]|uniref:Helix-turn-helix transcriptional regulator n=1 Tax=Cohnella herbarum TaxID=2728023 RepID=A0A7Z2VPU8_9BACL|nr:helix-turn-helix domain-containing protein [Cohnella herbarum]QJD87102.1 helix-turn-helix transcriptional regulator [Cohnella herbarum]
MNGLFRSVSTRYHRSSVLFKLLIVNMIFIILLTGLLGFNYSYLKANVKEQVVRTNEGFLKQLSGDLSGEWLEIRNMIYNFSVSLDTKLLSNNPKNSRSYYPTLLAYKNKITQTNLQLPFRAQLSTYFPNQDLVISSDGTRSLSVFYKNLDVKNGGEVCRCLLQDELERLHNFRNTIVFSYRLFPEGYIFVQIAKAELLAYLSNQTMLLDNVIVVSDRENQLYVSTAALDPAVSGQPLSELSGPIMIEGNKYTPISQTDPLFTYTVLFSQSQMQEKLQKANAYTFVLFALFLAVNLGFLFVNWSMFKPLRLMARTFNQWTTGPATKNEFAILSDTFKELNSATVSMKQEINEQADILEHNALLRLSTDENYTMKPNISRMLSAKYHSYAILTVIEENNQGQSVAAYAPLLEAALGQNGPFIRLHAHSDKSIFITSCSDAKALEALVSRVVESHPDPEGNELVFCGISSVHTRLEDIGKALHESTDAIDKHVPDLNHLKSVVLYQDRNSDQAAVIHLSIDKEQELVNYTLKGSTESLQQFFDKTIQKTFKNLTFEQFRNMLRYFHDLLLVIMNSKKISVEEVWAVPPAFSHTYHLQYLFRQIQEGYFLVSKRSALPITPLLEQIKKYIDENYADPDLSLTLIADHLAITHVYLSTYFKKHSGYNLNYYMHLVRIQAAIRLIQSHPNMTMKDIAEQVGYSNAGTFIRHFKKVSGTTPTQHVRLQQE